MATDEIEGGIIKAAFDGIEIGKLVKEEKGNYWAIVIERISQWRLLLGCMKDVDSHQLLIEAKYLVAEHGKISFYDVDMAIKLFLNQKLEIKYNNFLVFSPAFITQLILAYDKYKKEVCVNLIERADKILNQLPPGTKEERVQGMKDCIKISHENIEKPKMEYGIINSMVYDYLISTKKIILTDDLKKDAWKYSTDNVDAIMKEMRKEDVSSNLLSGISGASKYDKDFFMRMLRRYYCLKTFYEQNNIEDIINSVSIKELVYDNN